MRLDQHDLPYAPGTAAEIAQPLGIRRERDLAALAITGECQVRVEAVGGVGWSPGLTTGGSGAVRQARQRGSVARETRPQHAVPEPATAADPQLQW